LRVAPCSGHAASQKFNNLLRECVCTITNNDFTDVQWMQARNGGLGVRRVSSLAPSAFLASAAGTRDLQDMILFKCDALIDSTFDDILVQWTTTHGQSDALLPVGSLSPNNMNGTSLLLLLI